MPVTNYLWDGENILAEYHEVGAPTAVYTYQPEEYGRLLSQHRDGATSYYQFDAAGSTRALTDENGAVTDTWIYDAWGNEVSRTGSTENPFTWNGQWGYYYYEETGGYYVRRRPYDPVTGAWTAKDPIWPDGDPNPYRYAENNPVNVVDPSGQQGIVANLCYAPCFGPRNASPKGQRRRCPPEEQFEILCRNKWGREKRFCHTGCFQFNCPGGATCEVQCDPLGFNDFTLDCKCVSVA